MFLSKIIVDVHHPSARQALINANDMHRNIMAGFSMSRTNNTPRANEQVLYRIFSSCDQTFILVSSIERPNSLALAKRGLHTENALIRDISSLRQSFTPGKLLSFELFASPSKKICGVGKNSKRVFLADGIERFNWLDRKGKTGGFDIITANELSGRIDVVGKRGTMIVKNSGVLFSGILRITDTDNFWQSYTCGIGAGKAYGMGMLNVKNV